VCTYHCEIDGLGWHPSLERRVAQHQVLALAHADLADGNDVGPGRHVGIEVAVLGEDEIAADELSEVLW